MEKFKIAIEETIVKEFEVWAEDSCEALDIAKDKYNNGEFVLDPGDVQFKQMASVGNEPTEWIEF